MLLVHFPLKHGPNLFKSINKRCLQPHKMCLPVNSVQNVLYHIVKCKPVLEDYIIINTIYGKVFVVSSYLICIVAGYILDP